MWEMSSFWLRFRLCRIILVRHYASLLFVHSALTALFLQKMTRYEGDEC